MSLDKGTHLTVLKKGGRQHADCPNLGSGPGSIPPPKESLIGESEEHRWARNAVAEIICQVTELRKEYGEADKERKREIRETMKLVRARQAAALRILKSGD